MRKLFSILSILVVCVMVCLSSFSVSASRKSPVATTRPRQSNTNPTGPNGEPIGGDSSKNDPSTANPQDDSSEWFRTSTTVPYGADGGDGSGVNGGTGTATTSPVTGDYVVYSVLIAAGLGLSSLFAYKKFASKKK